MEKKEFLKYSVLKAKTVNELGCDADGLVLIPSRTFHQSNL